MRLASVWRALNARPPRLAASRSQRPRQQLAPMASAQDGAPAPAPVCVHAATAAELAAARQQLQEAEPLVAQRATTNPPQPEQHCALAYPDSDSSHESICGTFSAPAYLAALQTRVLGRVLLTAAATPSTQTVVQEGVARLPDGLVFVADRQLGGKGRAGNRWESPAGCLMFTALRRLAIPGQRLPFVQYVVSLAVVQAVQAEAAARLQGGGVDVRIKWPNDLYAGGLKLGGILCHSSYRDGRFYVVMGVGLNLSNRQPTTCVDALIEAAAAAARAGDAGGGEARQQGQQAQAQQAQEAQQAQQQQGRQQGQQAPAVPPVSREALLAGVLSRLEPMLERLAADGFSPFEADYCANWLHSEQQVLLEEGGQRIPVTIRGLSPNGYLLATDAGGERYELHPDGNSLDFMQGLVRKKLPAA